MTNYTLEELNTLIEAKKKELQPPINEAWSFKIGRSYLIRTVTFISVGKVKNIYGACIELENASWIADTGRFSQTLVEGPEKFDEVEPYPDGVFIALASIVDFSEWKHILPTEVK